MKQIRLLLFLIGLFFILNGYSQVTIGSVEMPVEGSLLQLKENEGSLKNSNKGLLLPRVNLIDKTPEINKLAESIGGVSDSDPWNENAHIGLMVYNSNAEVCADLGIHIWTGDRWESLIPPKEPSTDVLYYTDTRSHGGSLSGTTQVYPYRYFKDAGYWMLENMRYIPDASSSIQIPEGINKPSNNYFDKYYSYPNQTTVNTVPTTWEPNQGLIYTYSAATLGAQDGEDIEQGVQNKTDIVGDNEVENVSGWPTKFQGICPDGWHIPSDREWTQLVKSIMKDMILYSRISTTEVWNPNWNTSTLQGSTPDKLSFAMMAKCNFPNVKTNTKGQSLPIDQGGFNVLLTNVFGTNSIIWTSSLKLGYNAWSRAFIAGNPAVYRNNATSIKNLFSVRCKMD